METGTTLDLTHKDFLRVDKDHEEAASAAHLVYVRNCDPGILRVKKGKGFAYLTGKKTIKDQRLLDRIRKLAIPPAWTQVWICTNDKGHIQATGLDVRGRKQYRYHPLWNSLRNETKFHRLFEFGKALPLLRRQVEKDLAGKDLSQDKVLATLVSLMEKTFIRVGNQEYEKTNGSYGLTTLKNNHVSISGDKILFSFTGKKGIHHDVTLRSKRLARIVAQCQDIPGKELFQYFGEDGDRHPVDSGMVNSYIRQATGQDFSAKDFRTWAGSLHALQEFHRAGATETETEKKKQINLVLDSVSSQLGNTRTVCRKYYVLPALIALYEEDKLEKYFPDARAAEDGRSGKGAEEGGGRSGAVAKDDDGAAAGLAADEKVLMKILKG